MGMVGTNGAAGIERVLHNADPEYKAYHSQFIKPDNDAVNVNVNVVPLHDSEGLDDPTGKNLGLVVATWLSCICWPYISTRTVSSMFGVALPERTDANSRFAASIPLSIEVRQSFRICWIVLI